MDNPIVDSESLSEEPLSFVPQDDTCDECGSPRVRPLHPDEQCDCNEGACNFWICTECGADRNR